MQVRQIALACALLAGCDDGGSSPSDGPGSGSDAAAIDAPNDVAIDMGSSIDSPGGGPFTASGPITTSGPANPVFVAWQVTSGSPDYLWKFGEGTSTATTFMVTMGSNPPAQAINSYGLAIGIVVMFPDGIALPPDGIIDEFDPIAATGNHWIIFKATGATASGWPTSFPDGYACGVCVPATGGSTFDTFAVTACDGLQMVRNLDDVCNWT